MRADNVLLSRVPPGVPGELAGKGSPTNSASWGAHIKLCEGVGDQKLLPQQLQTEERGGG